MQVVDAASPKSAQLYKLAESCENAASVVTIHQNFTRMSVADMEDKLKRVVFRAFKDREVLEHLRPAVMFTLCTKMCNHVDSLGEESKV